MRAETQNNITLIEKSLKLLAQRMDWETAPHRLEEFNALIEDPNLWNDPAKAQNPIELVLQRSVFDKLNHAVADYLDSMTLQDLMEKQSNLNESGMFYI